MHTMRVVGCFIERVRQGTSEREYLTVLRLPYKIDGNHWGLISGKVESDESDEAAIIREVYEESGYRSIWRT